MPDQELLATEFDANRDHLRAVAYRMLGSGTEADDAVQEAWVRLSRSDVGTIDNLGGWLTTVVSRVCLDMLRARKVRTADVIDDPAKEVATTDSTLDPEHEAMLGDAVGAAMLVVLDHLGPAERVAFVLHDTFGVPFDQIAPIVGRSAEATRQLASRARNRVRGADASGRVDPDRQRELVTAFLAAAREGEFDRLLAILDPDVVLVPDAAAEKMGTPAGLRGARDVAGVFSGRAQAAQPALVNGLAGLVWATGGTPRVVFAFTLDGDRVVRIDTIADPHRIAELDIELLDG